MVKLARQPAYCGRPENSTANPIGLATLTVCLLNANTSEDVTRIYQFLLVVHQVLSWAWAFNVCKQVMPMQT